MSRSETTEKTNSCRDANMRNTEAGELVDEAFEEAVDRIESFRAREDDDEKGESREGGDGEERA
ncbi:MAG: hypothetical protein WAM15_02385, partial [Candidatus Acidiferrales bacterium]